MHVKDSRRSVPHLSIAGCAAILYAVLLVAGSSCNLLHGDLIQDHHHGDNGDSSAVNHFCAWACQATADAVVEGGPPLLANDLVSGPAELTSAELFFSIYSSTTHSRAPPSNFFARLG